MHLRPSARFIASSVALTLLVSGLSVATSAAAQDDDDWEAALDAADAEDEAASSPEAEEGDGDGEDWEAALDAADEAEAAGGEEAGGSADGEDWESALDEADAAGTDGEDWEAALDDADANEEQAETPYDEGLVLPGLGATTFSITSTTLLRYRGDNANNNNFDDDFFSGLERLEIAMQTEELRLTTRIDAFLPLDGSTFAIRDEDDCPEALRAQCVLRPDLRLERATLRFQRDELTLELGDTYLALGRSIAIAYQKADSLGIDNTMRGINALLDYGPAFMRFFAGVNNPQNVNPNNLGIFEQSVDPVIGAEAGVRFGENEDIEVAVHINRTWFEEPDSVATDGNQTLVNESVTILGGRLSMPSLADGHLALYVEGMLAQRDPREDLVAGERRVRGEVELGRAIYASAQLHLGTTSILLEWKDYDEFRNSLKAADPWAAYTNAPALERVGERIRDNFNSRGGRLQLDHAFGTSPYSFSVRQTAYGHAELGDPWDGIFVSHTAAVFQKGESGNGGGIDYSFSLELGARFELYLTDVSPIQQTLDLDWRVFHVLAEFSISAGIHSWELQIRHREERRLFLDYDDYIRGGASLTWSIGGVLLLTPILQWNSERTGRGPMFPGGEIRWNFLDGSFLRLFVGVNPGGLVCSGGICRDVPPSEGGDLELVIRL